MVETAEAQRVRDILGAVGPLAAEYYRLTGKPLGVMGEVAEFVASGMLGLELVPPRTTGYDAIRRTRDGIERIQIKGRAYGEDAKPEQRLWARSSATRLATKCFRSCWIPERWKRGRCGKRRSPLSRNGFVAQVEVKRARRPWRTRVQAAAARVVAA